MPRSSLQRIEATSVERDCRSCQDEAGKGRRQCTWPHLTALLFIPPAQLHRTTPTTAGPTELVVGASPAASAAAIRQASEPTEFPTSTAGRQMTSPKNAEICSPHRSIV